MKAHQPSIFHASSVLLALVPGADFSSSPAAENAPVLVLAVADYVTLFGTAAAFAIF